MNSIREIILAAPTSDRVAYFESHFGQLVGWMTDPDKRFLTDWLPGVALRYPTYPMTIVEVGTFSGSTARGLIALSGGGKITCIDNWKDVHVSDPSKQWRDTLQQKFNLLQHATLIEGDLAEIGAKWVQPIDLLLVDADHSYVGAITDIRNFAPKVVPGGYCLVDDYDLPDVIRACTEFFDSTWEPLRLPTEHDNKLACWRRREA